MLAFYSVSESVVYIMHVIVESKTSIPIKLVKTGFADLIPKVN